jgi:RimJ/RimL family protein N-acetyltransferase
VGETAPPDDDLREIRPPLEGRRVRLRAREEADLARLNELFDDPDVLLGLAAVTFPQPMDGIREWWEASRKDPNAQHFVIEPLEGEPIGACSLESVNARSRDAVLGIWIGKPYWDSGYGTDAIRTLCRFGFRHMNLQRITLHVHATNPRARHVYQRVGFRLEGTMRRAHFMEGRHVDVHVMGLLAEELLDEG